MDVVNNWSIQFDAFSALLQVACDLVGNVYVLEYDADQTLVEDALLTKYSATRHMLWRKKIEIPFVSGSVMLTSNGVGDISIAGATDRIAWTTLYDTAGEQRWHESWEIDAAVQLFHLSSSRRQQTQVIGMQAETRTVWGRYYASDGRLQNSFSWQIEETDEVHSMAYDGAGHLYLTGTIHYGEDAQLTGNLMNAWLAKFTLTGEEVWREFWGTSNWDQASLVTCDLLGHVYLGGITEGQLGDDLAQGGPDVWLAQYDSNGKQLWLDQWGSLATDQIDQIICDTAGNIYAVGITAGEMGDFPRYPGTDAWLAKFGPNGEQLWLHQWSNGRDNQTDGIACDGQAGVCWVGRSVEEDGDESTAWLTRFHNEAKGLTDLNLLMQDLHRTQALIYQAQIEELRKLIPPSTTDATAASEDDKTTVDAVSEATAD